LFLKAGFGISYNICRFAKLVQRTNLGEPLGEP